jgi:hypothetical protein
MKLERRYIVGLGPSERCLCRNVIGDRGMDGYECHIEYSNGVTTLPVSVYMYMYMYIVHVKVVAPCCIRLTMDDIVQTGQSGSFWFPKLAARRRQLRYWPPFRTKLSLFSSAKCRPG